MINAKQFRILVWLVIGLLVLNISALGTILWMRQRPPLFPEREMSTSGMHERQLFHRHDAMMKEEGGLTDEQLASFQKLRRTHFDEIKGINLEIMNTREVLFEKLRSGTAGSTTVDSLSEIMGALHQQWTKSTARFLTGVGSLCTPEQRGKVFDALKKSRKHQESFGRKIKQKDGGRRKECLDSDMSEKP